MQEFNSNRIVLNLELCREFCLRNEVATLWHYSVLVYLTRGLGYSNKEELIESAAKFTGLSKSTVRKWIPKLHHYTSKHGKNLHINSKKKVCKLFDLKPSRANIVFFEENLLSYKSFKKLILVQLGLTLQRRFSYAWADMHKHSQSQSSAGKSGRIDHSDNVPSCKDDVGVSLSKLSDYTGIAESTVSNYIRDVSEKKIKIIEKLYYSKFKKKYNREFFKINPLYGYCIPSKEYSYPYNTLFSSKDIYNKESKDIYIYKKISSKVISPNQSKRSLFRNA